MRQYDHFKTSLGIFKINLEEITSDIRNLSKLDSNA